MCCADSGTGSRAKKSWTLITLLLCASEAESELESVRDAAGQWQAEAEKRIRLGQRLVDQAEARANQVCKDV